MKSNVGAKRGIGKTFAGYAFMAIARKCLSFAFAVCIAANLSAAGPPVPSQSEKTGRFVDARLPDLPRSIIEELPSGCVQAWKPVDARRSQTRHGSTSYAPVLTPAEQQAAARLRQLRPQRLPAASQPAIQSSLSPVRSPGAAGQTSVPIHGVANRNARSTDTPGKHAPYDPADDADDLLAGGEDLLTEDLLTEDLLTEDAAPSDDPLADFSNPPGDSLPAPRDRKEAYNPHAGATLTTPVPKRGRTQIDPHHELLLENKYPSAQTCAECHPQHYKEWSVSGHAYATISPMFQRFEQKITELTEGTVGHFCVRCHGPVAIQMEYPRDASILDAPKIVREGITCIACHRVNKAYGRTNGLRRVEPGDIHHPVYSGSPGSGLPEAIARRNELKLKIDRSDKGPGQAIHAESRAFEPLSRSDFCASCHQVSVHPGIWLEIVHAQYRSGPAAAKGISCQDCHMGQVPGKPYGYEQNQIAELNGKAYGEPRKKSNHRFWGPGYSIAHPGLFPMNAKADRWSPRQWLAFDDRSDWGKEGFERNIAPQLAFPPPWDNPDDRRDARKILEENQRLLREARAGSLAAMEAGSAIEGPTFEAPVGVYQPLRFRYRVHNVSEGHNFPTGSLGAQPQVWLNVVLIGPDGQRVWESGYLDTQGDLADLQSADVATGKVPRDSQLFNLQTKFLINSFKGTDREVALPLNFNLDQLVFLRPGAVPIRVLNHPPLIRMEAHSIPPLGSRAAKYHVPAERMREPGVYRLSVRLRSRVEPSYFMRMVDSTPDMIRRMNEGILDIHPSSHTFIVK